MDLDDLRISICVIVIMFVLLITMSAGLAHCSDASSQTNCELVSMYIKHKNPKLPREIREHIACEVVYQAAGAGLPYETITAIMCIESCYNPSAIGPMGEIGLMQIYTMECGGGIEKIMLEKGLLFNIEYNIAAGICILLDKLRAADGDIIQAIGRYNGSGAAADRFRVKVCRVILDIFRFRVANRDRLRRLEMLGARG